MTLMGFYNDLLYFYKKSILAQSRRIPGWERMEGLWNKRKTRSRRKKSGRHSEAFRLSRTLSPGICALIVVIIFSHYSISAQTADAAYTQLEKLIDAGRLREAEERLSAAIKASGEPPATLLVEARLLFKRR
jgi:hypothetical protein